jgi:charged multivesicular body protein 5
VESKIQALDKQLVPLKQQLDKSKSLPEKQRIKQRCVQLLKQKKMYEQQRDSLFNQQMNLEQTTFMTNQLKDNMDTFQTMKESTQGMKSQMKGLNIEKIDQLQDDMADLMDDANEINEMMSRSYATPEIDESDLMDELDSLETEIQEEATSEKSKSSYLDELDDTSVTIPKKKIGITN